MSTLTSAEINKAKKLLNVEDFHTNKRTNKQIGQRQLRTDSHTNKQIGQRQLKTDSHTNKRRTQQANKQANRHNDWSAWSTLTPLKKGRCTPKKAHKQPPPPPHPTLQNNNILK